MSDRVAVLDDDGNLVDFDVGSELMHGLKRLRDRLNELKHEEVIGDWRWGRPLHYKGTGSSNCAKVRFQNTLDAVAARLGIEQS